MEGEANGHGGTTASNDGGKFTFEGSTHHKNWILDSLAALNDVRTQTWRAAIERKGEQSTGWRVEDESAVQHYYAVKIPEVCSFLHYPIKVKHCALAFFARFFLHNSVLEFHPKLIMLCCLYVACKAEEHHVNVEDLAGNLQEPRGTGKMVLDTELPLLSRIKFNLYVFHPNAPLRGFIQHMKNLGLCNQETGSALLSRAQDLVSQWSTNLDLQLLYPPAQIALAALQAASAGTTVDVGQYVMRLESKDQSKLVKLQQNLSEIPVQARRVPNASREDVMELDKKYLPPFIPQEDTEGMMIE